MVFDPATVPGYFAHYKADTLTGADGAALASWPDSSPNALHVTQATAANQPVVRTNVLNGMRVAEFTPTQFLTSAAFAANAQPNTVFLVAKPDVLPSVLAKTLVAFDGVAASRRWAVYVEQATNEWRAYAGGVLDSNVAIETGRWYRIVVVLEGTTSDIFVDDAAAVRGSSGTHSVTAVRLGAHFDGTLGWDGQIAEVLVYDARVSQADIDVIRQYLWEKWFTAPDQPAQVTVEGGSTRSAAVAAAAGRSGLVESGTGRQPNIEA